ncbi:tyrosine-type recombinase/integrase [Streptomyces thermolilacinus]
MVGTASPDLGREGRCSGAGAHGNTPTVKTRPHPGPGQTERATQGWAGSLPLFRHLGPSHRDATSLTAPGPALRAEPSLHLRDRWPDSREACAPAQRVSHQSQRPSRPPRRVAPPTPLLARADSRPPLGRPRPHHQHRHHPPLIPTHPHQRPHPPTHQAPASERRIALPTECPRPSRSTATVGQGAQDRKARLERQSLVFTTPNGGPLDSTNPTRRFHTFLDRAGLRRTRFHDIRHTAARLLLEQGADLVVIRELLSHAHIGVTADAYIRLPLQRQAIRTRPDRRRTGRPARRSRRPLTLPSNRETAAGVQPAAVLRMLGSYSLTRGKGELTRESP